MKIYLVLLTFIYLSIFSSCNSKEKQEATNNTENVGASPSIVFNEEKYDFGTINQGEKVSHAFRFKNTGNNDLLIIAAEGSCGCTVPTYPKTPIKAGEEANIDVVFDSDGKSGMVEKTVKLLTNCKPNTSLLTIHANIITNEEK